MASYRDGRKEVGVALEFVDWFSNCEFVRNEKCHHHTVVEANGISRELNQSHGEKKAVRRRRALVHFLSMILLCL